PFDIPALLTSAGVKPPLDVRGQAQLKARLEGPAARPSATVEARVDRLALRGQKLGDATAKFALVTPEGTDARIDVQAFGGNVSLRGQAPVTPARLTRLSRTALLRTPVSIDAAIDELPLRPFAVITGNDTVNAGTVTLRLEGRGTAQAPTGDLK